MKLPLQILLSLAFIMPALAEEKAKIIPLPSQELFRAGEWQLDLNGIARDNDPARDADNLSYGGGFGVNYFPWRASGFGLEFQTEDTASAFFDRIGVAWIGRMPIEKLHLAPEFKVGYDYDFERGDTDHQVFDKKAGEFRTVTRDGSGHEVFASVGGEFRLSKRVGFGAEVRGVKPLDGSNEYLLGIARVRFNF